MTDEIEAGATTGDRMIGAISRGVLGAVPGIGPIVSELLSEFIPNQRLERLEMYFRHLEKRLDHFETGELHRRMKLVENIDLFEDGAIHAVHALSDERKTYIAAIVAKGISGDEKRGIEAKRLLQVLSEIDDTQIIMLARHLQRYMHDDEFYDLHRKILSRPVTHTGSDQDTLDQAAIHIAAEEQLVRIGLMSYQFRKTKKGELPEFDDKTGMIKRAGKRLTPLGRLFLRFIDIAENDEI